MKVHIVDRLSESAPHRESQLLALSEGYQHGDEFIIQRRVGIFPLRWDACLMEITDFGPSMVKVGFGLTKTGALRKMHKSEEFRIIDHFWRKL